MVKSHLKSRAKDILNSNPVGFVFQNDHPDFNFLMRIFQGHPEYSIKAGIGIKSIFIGIAGDHPTRCFSVRRLDGSTTDISYIRSVDGATTKISDIKCACRHAIRSIIAEERSKVKYGIDVCPISGVILTPENTNIDHYDKTFDELFNTWIKSENIDLAHACLNDASKDNEHNIYFTSKFLTENFIAHHNANTNLRAVSKKANLSTLRKKS